MAVPEPTPTRIAADVRTREALVADTAPSEAVWLRPSGADLARLSPADRRRPDAVNPVSSHRLPSSLDLDAWPFGWVREPVSTRDLGLGPRFWSDRKPLWRRILTENPPAAVQVKLLEELWHEASSPEEALRAAWLAADTCRRAGLGTEARLWLDRASMDPSAVVGLYRAWDQVYRLRDALGARAFWPAGLQNWRTDEQRLMAVLLRQRLFLDVHSLKSIRADDFVSTTVLDRDDVWAGTWNGAVVRWSLATGDQDLIQGAGAQVAPVKLMTVTRWFVYVFQDQFLQRYSKVTGTWRTFPYPEGWNGLRIQGVVPEDDRNLWVAVLGQGLWRWESGNWLLVDEGGGGPFLNTLDTDGAGGLWIGTKDRGLWHWAAGHWAPVPAEGRGPANISVLAREPGTDRWAVGTWGEGTWILDAGKLKPGVRDEGFVTAAAWSGGEPLWGLLDQGLAWGTGPGRTFLGPREGLPSGGVSGLSVWNGLWVWGTNGQGLATWSEHEDPALLQ